MKNLFIVANWKANKTEEEAIDWLRVFNEKLPGLKGEFENKEVIVCPSFPIIPVVKKYIQDNDLPLQIGSQDISRFGTGAYTGEVPTTLLKKFAQYCIIGHSERRQNFGETDEILKSKVLAAISSVMLPIFCVQNEKTFIPEDVRIVAYEPIEAIGTGNPDTPENAEKVALQIKSSNQGVMHVLYGGSVDEHNFKSFIEMGHIDGILVGGSSLDPDTFLKLLS